MTFDDIHLPGIAKTDGIRLVAAVCAMFAASERSRAAPPFAVGALPKDCAQVVVVRSVGREVFQAQVECWELGPSGWKLALASMPAVVGRNGVAEAGAKREGDGKSPAGVFQIGLAFGEEKAIPTGLEYRPTTHNDYWIDDPKSPDYNRWISTPPPVGVSAERMRRDDANYRCGAVIEYNVNPVVPGRGSAIFLHIWKSANYGTAGCVALCEADVRALLKWLDRKRSPVVVLGRGGGAIDKQQRPPER